MMKTVLEPFPSASLVTSRKTAIESLSAADTSQALATLTLAFAADPGVRWLFPDAASFLAGFPLFARAFGGAAFAAGSATGAAQGRAVALWLPPGAEPAGSDLVDVVDRHTPSSRRAEALELFERMGAFHPAEPHWYLPLIGTDPAIQRQGTGSQLLAHTLAQCDAAGLPAYLEATSERNVPLYQRHGFEVIGELRVGTCPAVTPMLRPSRSHWHRDP
jgi:GNAT superfamily N-acetyltransferase